jgi:hypothetical protein
MAPQRNIADGASDGATLMSQHSEDFMQNSSRHRKSSSNRSGFRKTGPVGKRIKATSRSVQKAPARRSARTTGSTTKHRVIGVGAKGSKQTALLDLLKRPVGATIAALVDASGWQQHSVRGFLTGVVRKKLGLKLVSVLEDNQRIYRIVTPKQT